MSTTLLFESFSSEDGETATVFLPKGKLEEARQAAHKAGYDLGFREAQAQADANRMEAVRNMTAAFQDCTFTQAEARRAVLDSLQPLVEKLIDVILPGVAHIGFADVVAAQISEIASSLTEGPIVLQCPETYRPAFEKLVANMEGLGAEVVVISDSSLGATEVRLSSPDLERRIDLDHALESIRENVSDYYISLAQKSA